MNTMPRRSRPRSLVSSALIYSAFAFTGFGIALLGATLPSMLTHWSLTDRLGGLLFFLLFLGSLMGAFLTRGSMVYSVARGAGLLVPACAALAFASGPAVFPLFFLYGLGLGITITSINRLQSQRRSDARVREMNRLNLIWALGALSCPWLANEALRLTSITFLFLTLGSMFAACMTWMLVAETDRPGKTEIQTQNLPRTLSGLPVVIALTALLATGLESSTSAWIAAFADRLRNGFNEPVAVASVFWFGLLASRTLHSTGMVGYFTERRLLQSAATVAVLGCGLLLVSHGQGILLIAAFLIGFGVGPIYPLLLAAVLPRVPGNTIFVMGGLGGTIFPWLTGALSAHAASLRVGMIVPTVASLAIFACAPHVSNAIGAVEQG